MQSYNIDWFYRFGTKWVHCSSQGGILPEKVDDSTFLPQLQTLFNIIPYFSESKDIEVNDELIKQRFERHMAILGSIRQEEKAGLNLNDREPEFSMFRLNYIETFVEMARKGFHSFVRFNIDDFTDNTTVLVAKPTNDATHHLSKIVNRILESVNSDMFNESSENFKKYLEGITGNDVSLDFQAKLLDFL